MVARRVAVVSARRRGRARAAVVARAGRGCFRAEAGASAGGGGRAGGSCCFRRGRVGLASCGRRSGRGAIVRRGAVRADARVRATAGDGRWCEDDRGGPLLRQRLAPRWWFAARRQGAVRDGGGRRDAAVRRCGGAAMRRCGGAAVRRWVRDDRWLGGGARCEVGRSEEDRSARRAPTSTDRASDGESSGRSGRRGDGD